MHRVPGGDLLANAVEDLGSGGALCRRAENLRPIRDKVARRPRRFFARGPDPAGCEETSAENKHETALSLCVVSSRVPRGRGIRKGPDAVERVGRGRTRSAIRILIRQQ